jgi:protein-disulfide isomerase
MNIEKIGIPIAIVVSATLIAGSIYLSSRTPVRVVSDNTKSSTSSIDIRPITTADHILGNPQASVILIEYSDTECPFCKTFHSTLKRMISEYGKTGKVAWVYRHFPIDQIHSRSRKEAEATECANDLGGSEKFWEYLDTLYSITTSNDTLDPKELPKIAKMVGLDVNAFNTCLNSGKFASKVEADYQDALKMCKGNSQCGTPSSVLIAPDGSKTPLQGAYSYDKLKLLIDAALE